MIYNRKVIIFPGRRDEIMAEFRAVDLEGRQNLLSICEMLCKSDPDIKSELCGVMNGTHELFSIKASKTTALLLVSIDRARKNGDVIVHAVRTTVSPSSLLTKLVTSDFQLINPSWEPVK